MRPSTPLLRAFVACGLLFLIGCGRPQTVEVLLEPGGEVAWVFSPRPTGGLCTVEKCMLSLDDGGYALVSAP